MKIIFHIGTEKTGSKSIQEFLYLNRKEFKKQKITSLRSLGLKNHQKIAVLCMDQQKADAYTNEHNVDDIVNRQHWKDNLSKKIHKELEYCGKWASTVIISSEHLHSRLSTSHEIQRLKSIFDEFATEYQVVFYLRRQDQLSVSLDSTRVRLYGSSSSVLHQIKKNKQYYNYFQLYRLWESVFKKNQITIRIFDVKEFYQESLIADFIKSCKLAMSPNYIYPNVKNQRLSSTLREFCVWFNESRHPVSNYDKALKQFIIKKLEADFNTEDIAPALPSRHEAFNFYHEYQKSNQQLAEHYFDSDVLFSEDFSMYPEQSSIKPLSIQKLNRIKKYEEDFQREIGFIPNLANYSVRLYYYYCLPNAARRFIYNILR